MTCRPRGARSRRLRARGPLVVVAKSLRLDDTPADALDMLAGDEAGFWRLRTPKLPIAVNGAGDLFAALFFHHWLETRATPEALVARGVVGSRDRGAPLWPPARANSP